jgi:hypothetical protein
MSMRIIKDCFESSVDFIVAPKKGSKATIIAYTMLTIKIEIVVETCLSSLVMYQINQ